MKMKRFRGLPSFLIIVGFLWLILRVAHNVIPAAQPEVLTGPFELDSLAAVEEITGFQPLVPVYHPISLGNDPVRIVAEREPEQMVTIIWRADRLLELIERRAGPGFEPPAGAESVAGRGDWWLWRSGATTMMSGTAGPVRIDLRTSLSREDALRVATTLVPLNEVR